MLVIRLRRTGKKKKPSFRVIVAEKTMPIYGRFVDIIGNVNLQSDPKVINIDKEKALDWIGKGTQPSHSVARLMVKQGILKEEDVRMNPEKKRVKKKEMKKEGGETKEAPTVIDNEKGSQPTADHPQGETKAEKTEEKPEEAKKEASKEEKPVEKIENKELEVKPKPEVERKAENGDGSQPTADHPQGEKTSEEKPVDESVEESRT